jgi:predicted nucleic acid-binding protein
MKKIDRVFLDTSFFIRLMKPDDPYHAHAQAYLRRFVADGATLYSSTIAAAEFGVVGTIENLPLRIVPMQAFDLEHARKAAAFARAAYDARRKGAIILPKRVLIPNDTKLLAQADLLKAQYMATRDENMIKVMNFLRQEGLTQCQPLDVMTPPQSFFGQLF